MIEVDILTSWVPVDTPRGQANAPAIYTKGLPYQYQDITVQPNANIPTSPNILVGMLIVPDEAALGDLLADPDIEVLDARIL